MINVITTSLALIAILAQADANSGTPEAKTAAQALLSQGTKLFSQGDFAAALDHFNQAYTAYPSPKLLYNIAQTERALGRPADAMNAFARLLRQAPDKSPEGWAEMASEVKDAMAELADQLGQLRIECSMPDAEIGLDGKILGTSPLSDAVWVEAGQHQVTARRANAIPVVEDVSVLAKATGTVALKIRPLASASYGPARTAESASPATAQSDRALPLEPTTLAQSARERRDQGWWLGRSWTWVAAGATVALLGSAAIVGATMKSRFDELDQSCGSASGPNYPGCSASAIQGVKSRELAANVLWAASGGGALATGALFFLEGRRVTLAPVAGTSPGLTARVGY
ncbi:MAG: tetratricopeptide repeat protein [Polyangia bacterium]